MLQTLTTILMSVVLLSASEKVSPGTGAAPGRSVEQATCRPEARLVDLTCIAQHSRHSDEHGHSKESERST
jgi:hypothetical protein